jgi:rubrerythrin
MKEITMSEQSQTVAAVKTAIQMEIDGKTFYQRAAQASPNALGKKLFRQLAAEEDIHRQKFEEIFKAIQSRKPWPDIKITPDKGKHLQTLFSSASKNVQSSASEMEAAQTAMNMENKTRDFYHEQAQKANFAAEKDYYLALEQQESSHHAALYEYYEYLKDPAGWFTMKERHSLDGG